MAEMVFEVEDTCILREDLERDYVKVPEGTIVEITKKYQGKLGIFYDVQTLACATCPLIVKIQEVPLDILQDYDEVYPSVDR